MVTAAGVIDSGSTDQFRMGSMLAFLGLLVAAIRGFVTEKEEKLKEGMKMMGLLESSLNVSWLIVYVIQTLLIAALASVTMSGGTFKTVGSTPIFTMLWLYAMCCCSFAYLLSAFFSKVQSASMLLPLYFICMLCIYLLIFILRVYYIE
jgi:hypothetical protein